MPEQHEFWDPNEWETHVLRLLQDRHGVLNVMKFPARHKGDCGLDYYCLCDHVAYQCYAVQEPCEVAARANKQKAKITKDLNKFCKSSNELKTVFGATQIRRWILVVPLHDSKQVNTHLTTKTEQVRKLSIPYVSHDFEAHIRDLESFEPQSRQARALGRKAISLLSSAPSVEEIDTWAQSAGDLATNLENKLSKRVGVGPQQLETAVREAISWFLEMQNALDSLRTTAPQLHETLVSVILRRTERLRLYGPPPDGTAHSILRSEVEELIAGLKAAIPNFTDDSAQRMALGTIAEWLLRCPLDFPPYSHVH